MIEPRELLERYRQTAEALHDALLAFASRMHTGNRVEYERLIALVEKCHEDLDQARREFRQMPDDLKRSR